MNLWVFFVIGTALFAGLFVLYLSLFRQNRKFLKRIAILEKSAGMIPYLDRLLRNTQKQIDSLLYDLERFLESQKGDDDSRRFLEPLRLILKKARGSRPPRIIPPHLLDAYTMGGKIRVEERYRDSGYPPEEPLFYDQEVIESYIKQIKKKTYRFPRYGVTNIWLFQALEKYPIRGKTVALIGSNKPFYESVCLAYGGRCTTIEYNRIETNHPELTFLTPDEYDKNPICFDAALSISSFEHDGLGRFGDPLNPQGDFEAMKKMKSMLKPGGLLFLAVPVGKDMLFWNAHRIYGRLRFPLLVQGWRIRESFGFKPSYFEDRKKSYEPVFVLENKEGEIPLTDRLELEAVILGKTKG